MIPYQYVDSNWCPDCGLPRGVCDCETRTYNPDDDGCWERHNEDEYADDEE